MTKEQEKAIRAGLELILQFDKDFDIDNDERLSPEFIEAYLTWKVTFMNTTETIEFVLNR